MHRFFFQKEIPIVHYTSSVESLQDELFAFKVSVNLYHSQLNDLDSVHRVSRLEDKLTLVVLLADICVEQLSKQTLRDGVVIE
jgi:hypothetical protein